MNDSLTEIRTPYEDALRGFLQGNGEESLQRAYEIGRQAVADGLGCLDMLKLHEDTLHRLLTESSWSDALPEIVRRASHFFAESLSPYEMTHRGFQESIEILRVRADELAVINRRLGSEIDERMVVEMALRDSEFRYRTLVETARDVIYTLSPEGHITSLNSAFEHLLGWLRDEWIGKHFAPLVHPDDMPLTMDMFKRILSGEYPSPFEIRILTRRGNYIITEFIKAPRMSEGKVIGVLGIGRDITQRRLAEEELKKREHQLAVAQQIAHIGSWEWDITTDSVRWSDELFKIFGVDRTKFAGTYQHYLDLVHPDDRRTADFFIRDALRKASSFKFEHRITLQNGSIRDIESRGDIILDAKGRPAMMTGTAQDITEQKKASQALRTLAKQVVDAQEEERKRISRELHDNICQRLSATKLHMEALQDRIREKRSPVRRNLTGLRRQIGTTIKEIRNISANLRPSTLDDLGLSTAVQLLCREFEKTHNIRVRVEADLFPKDVLPPHSETAIYRVTQEALANVAKHAHAKEVQVQLRRTDSAVLLTIKDNGRGFDESRTVQRLDGTGMGLFSMRERAQLAGGTFNLVSSRNKGTTLKLDVPIPGQDIHETH